MSDVSADTASLAGQVEMISAELGMSTIGSLPALPVAHGPFAAPFLSFVAAGHVIG